MRYRETQQISGIYEFSVMTTILQPDSMVTFTILGNELLI